MSGFLPSSEPAIGRSQELATVGWCRRTAELPLLVELERAACPQKSRKDQMFLCMRLLNPYDVPLLIVDENHVRIRSRRFFNMGATFLIGDSETTP